MCLPAIIDQVAIELIAAEIPPVLTTLDIMHFQLLNIEDWLKHFWVGNWWSIYGEMQNSFYVLHDVYLTCVNNPHLLEIPDVIKFVRYLNVCFNDFWSLTKVFPLSFNDYPTSIGEIQMRLLFKKVVWTIKKLYGITAHI